MGGAAGTGRGGLRSSGAGEHRCAISGEHPGGEVLAWVKEALHTGRRVLWLTSHGPDVVVRSLERDLPMAHVAVRDRRVVVQRLDRVLPPEVERRADALRERIRGEAGRATADGHAGLHLITELGPALVDGGESCVERLERVVAEAVVQGLCSALCLYEPGLPARVLLGAITCHPRIMEGGEVIENPAAVEPDQADSEARVRARLGKILDALRAHHRAARALYATEERSRRLVEGAPTALLTVDKEGRVVLANDACLSVLGVRAPADVGARLVELVPDAVLGSWLSNLFGSGSAPPLDLCIEGPDAVHLRLEGRVAPGGSSAEFAHCAIVDVTAQHHADLAMARVLADLELRHRVACIYAHDATQGAHVEVLRLAMSRVRGRFGALVLADGDDTMRGWLLSGEAGRANGAPRPIRLPGSPDAGGVWSRALMSACGVWSSEPELLAGSISVERSLVVPIVRRRQIAGMFVVADGPTHYGEEDCGVLESIAQEVAPMVDGGAGRTADKWRRSELAGSPGTHGPTARR
ncbi:MAG: hypothetical protein AMXMBFR64_61380 [Myxococcales bacterium]